MGKGARLPADQGPLGVRRKSYRRALPIRMARRERPVVSLLRQRAVGVRRARPDAAARSVNQRRGDCGEGPAVSLVGTGAKGRGRGGGGGGGGLCPCEKTPPPPGGGARRRAAAPP